MSIAPWRVFATACNLTRKTTGHTSVWAQPTSWRLVRAMTSRSAARPHASTLRSPWPSARFISKPSTIWRNWPFLKKKYPIAKELLKPLLISGYKKGPTNALAGDVYLDLGEKEKAREYYNVAIDEGWPTATARYARERRE